MEKIEATLKKTAANTSTGSTKGSRARPAAEGGDIPPRVAAGPGDPDCPHCHGVGYIREEVEVGHPNFGKLFACSCRLPEIEAALRERRREVSSLGPLAHKTFDNFQPEGHASQPGRHPSLRRALNEASKYAEAPRGWLLLQGGYGCGKTHLAAAIANAQLAAGHLVMFVNAPDLLDHLRVTFGPGSEISYDEQFERIRNIPLLVIDDLGAESPTQWAQEKLYQLFNHRYNAVLPTVITTNIELDRIDPRIRSRLVDMDLVRKIAIEAPDFRRADTAGQPEISSLEQHRHQTFETFDNRKGELPPEHYRFLHEAFTEAKRFAADPQGWLIFTGAHGCGKTHLAAAIANERDRHGHPALFITSVDLLDHLRATFSPDSFVRYDKRFTEIKTTPLLALDDLSLESATPWAKEKLFQIIDYRYVTELPTVITTSANPDEIETKLQVRLRDPRLSVICPITAPMYKGGKGSQRKGRKPHAR